MAADIYTKGFPNAAKFSHALGLIGVRTPVQLRSMGIDVKDRHELPVGAVATGMRRVVSTMNIGSTVDKRPKAQPTYKQNKAAGRGRQGKPSSSTQR